MEKTYKIDLTTKRGVWKNRAKVFANAFMQQAMDEGTLATSAIVGLHQGLKYNGNLKNGVVAGLACECVFGIANGVRHVYKYTR